MFNLKVEMTSEPVIEKWLVNVACRIQLNTALTVQFLQQIPAKFWKQNTFYHLETLINVKKV